MCDDYSNFSLENMAVMEGSLSKWTNVMKGWQYRWFVLDENSGLLSYYTVSKITQRFLPMDLVYII